MVGSRKFSYDEVEAFLGGLEGEEEQTVATQFDPNEVREFTFGSEDLSLLGDYYALRMINEKICRFTRSVFLPMLRIMPRISSFPPEVKSFDEYVESCEQYVSVTNNRIEELRGNCLIVIRLLYISFDKFLLWRFQNSIAFCYSRGIYRHRAAYHRNHY